MEMYLVLVIHKLDIPNGIRTHFYSIAWNTSLFTNAVWLFIIILVTFL